jgi:hypothetical protein
MICKKQPNEENVEESQNVAFQQLVLPVIVSGTKNGSQIQLEK